ncbi:methylation-associated defense system AAA family ATPase MAD3 [Streptosporangium amethystogenes]|uniref:methylation-associated defense system AAA family ATPase MAD3 n=1 Tax=Streptosporangium amethystogenes TaxID=2002 RepID=UPI0004C7A37C|nr:AAA family ATPase [Streptosporangium amethystogenes]
MITRIEAYGYRCFPGLGIDLDRYHVLAGANGAGKTTLLDIPVLIGDLVRQQRAVAAFLEPQRPAVPARANSLVELLHKGEGDAIAFAIEARLPDDVVEVLSDTTFAELTQRIPTHLRYELRLEVGPHALNVADEYLFLFSDQGPRPRAGEFPQGITVSGTTLRHAEWQPVILREGRSPTRFIHETTTQESDLPPLRVPQGQLALGAVPADPTLFPAALWFAQLLREGVVFFDPDWDLLRRPAPPGYAPRLMPSGMNTPWLALDLRQRDPERFASWIDHVRTALPQIADITVIEREEDHHAYFAVEYAGGYRVTSSGLSEGTLRILVLTLLSYLDGTVLPTLLVTEEPENGIHPRAIETVVQSLSSLYDSQVWISTHSPIVLAHTDLTDVLAARLDDGGVQVIPGDRHPRLRDWQGSLDIGTLFAAGVLS